MDVHRSDPRRLGAWRPRAHHVSRGELGPARSRHAHRARRQSLAAAVMTVVDEKVWGVAVPSVSAVERELARLRRMAGAHAKEQGHTVARAAVLNLVVYVDRDIPAPRAAGATSRLSDRHPPPPVGVFRR